MNRTTLVSAVALGLGLLLATGGSVILAHARAAVRADSPRYRSTTQFPAALSALLGFLLTSVSGAVLCWRLAPGGGATALLAAIVAGVILFALVGASFARVADRVEERQLRQVPEEVHRPISPPPRRRALAAAPASSGSATTGGSGTTRPTPSGPRALPARSEPPALPRPRQPADPSPFGYATPLVPVPPRSPAVRAIADATPRATDGTGDERLIPTAEPAGSPAEGVAAAGSPAERAPAATPPAATAPDETEPADTTSTESTRAETRTAAPANTHPAVDTAHRGSAAPEDPAVSPTVETSPTDPAWAKLDAGWMYHDQADRWFLAVGTSQGGLALLGLPAFALITPGGPDAPVGTLSRAGAAELTVLPDDEPESAETPLTEENGVNDPPRTT